MIKFKALLKFPKIDRGRTNPIESNYRPLFKFCENYVSGAIITKNDVPINPGEEATVDICISSDNLIGEVSEGQRITFWEPPIKIGEITITDIIKEV